MGKGLAGTRILCETGLGRDGGVKNVRRSKLHAQAYMYAATHNAMHVIGLHVQSMEEHFRSVSGAGIWWWGYIS